VNSTGPREGSPHRDDREPVLDGGRPDEHQRDSSIPAERRPAPEPAGDAQPPVVTGDADEDDEPAGSH
jgi:hypothetical protein